MGIPDSNIVLADIGNIIEVSNDSINVVGTVPSGITLVDGYGIGDVGNVVLRDRKHLSQDGLVVVAAVVDSTNRTLLTDPEILSRGFVYIKENASLMRDVRKLAVAVIEECAAENYEEWVYNVKTRLRDRLSKYIYEHTKRRPMILPVVKDL